MKIKEGFVVREIAGECVVIALGEASKVFNGMIKLNASARLIWEMLSQGCEKQEIIEKILDDYEVDRETAQRDFDRFIDTLKGVNILE